jgi:hypothetical protein
LLPILSVVMVRAVAQPLAQRKRISLLHFAQRCGSWLEKIVVFRATCRDRLGGSVVLSSGVLVPGGSG